MSDTKKTGAVEATAQNDLEEVVAQAEALDEEAQAAPTVGVYTHTFQTPFTYEGRTFDRLTFDWTKLTGTDSLAIEDDMLLHGKNLVTPEFTGIYLMGMAARACTERDEDGHRVVSTQTLQTLPLGDFNRICKKARLFLLRAGR